MYTFYYQSIISRHNSILSAYINFLRNHEGVTTSFICPWPSPSPPFPSSSLEKNKNDTRQVPALLNARTARRGTWKSSGSDLPSFLSHLFFPNWLNSVTAWEKTGRRLCVLLMFYRSTPWRYSQTVIRTIFITKPVSHRQAVRSIILWGTQYPRSQDCIPYRLRPLLGGVSEWEAVSYLINTSDQIYQTAPCELRGPELSKGPAKRPPG